MSKTKVSTYQTADAIVRYQVISDDDRDVDDFTFDFVAGVGGGRNVWKRQADVDQENDAEQLYRLK